MRKYKKTEVLGMLSDIPMLFAIGELGPSTIAALKKERGVKLEEVKPRKAKPGKPLTARSGGTLVSRA